MAVNRFITALSAALLGVFTAGAAVAVPASPPPPADIGGPGVNVGVPSGDNLGFGEYLGTWIKDAPVTGPSTPGPAMPNTRPSGNNADEVGAAILAQYPGLFDVDEFNLAGSADDFPSFVNTSTQGFKIDSVVSSYVDEDGKTQAIAAKWVYTGFDPVLYPEPGDDPVDLFVSVKYGQYISFFHYELVKPGQYGYVTTDFRVILNETPADAPSHKPGLLTLREELNYNGLDDFYNASTGKNTCNVAASGNFNDDCMPYNNGNMKNPIGISHVTAYWPPADELPEPSAIGLMGLGLAALLLKVRPRNARNRSSQS
jgi:hypothetical protein